jgi:hypothetical protein
VTIEGPADKASHSAAVRRMLCVHVAPLVNLRSPKAGAIIGGGIFA